MFGDFMLGSEVREQNIYSSFFSFHALRYTWRRVFTLGGDYSPKRHAWQGSQVCYTLARTLDLLFIRKPSVSLKHNCIPFLVDRIFVSTITSNTMTDITFFAIMSGFA